MTGQIDDYKVEWKRVCRFRRCDDLLKCHVSAKTSTSQQIGTNIKRVGVYIQPKVSSNKADVRAGLRTGMEEDLLPSGILEESLEE
ncbi:MAG TPA: hypothetical protein VN841_10615 [Bryobacteraceae bacterium]|nr:hypothetical protein [Bryobacteraceae bacterium]